MSFRLFRSTASFVSSHAKKRLLHSGSTFKCTDSATSSAHTTRTPFEDVSNVKVTLEDYAVLQVQINVGPEIERTLDEFAGGVKFIGTMLMFANINYLLVNVFGQ